MPNPLEILVDQVSLYILGLYAVLIVWEAIFPARKLPHIKYWKVKGIISFFFFFFLSTYLPLWYDKWLPTSQLFDLSSTNVLVAAASGILLYELGMYLWHRTIHSNNLLWRTFHQMHHSAERLDTYGAFYFSPLDMIGFTFLGTVCFSFIMGLPAQAVTVVLLVTNFFSIFQHANIKTPVWLGYIIQRPESHAMHHSKGVHASNYSDLPLFDILFGTFRNPSEYVAETGFYKGASSKVKEMLLFKDIALLFLLTVSLLTSNLANAQTKTIQFESGTWEEIKTISAKENKLIFLDAYTTWCGICKSMEKNVFTNDTVADYFNANFINAKIDMEAGEGIDIAKQYSVNIYPSLLFIDGQGNVIHRTTGVHRPQPFIELAKDAQNPDKQNSGMIKTYEAGSREAAQTIPNKLEIGFNISQYQKDFGIGLHVISPYFMKKTVAIKAGTNIQWFENSNGTKTTWTTYQNIQLGMRGRSTSVTHNISIYGEGGVFIILPNSDFSSRSFVLGGYGLFGFEFKIVPRFAYFIELGGVGTGATADKIASKPIYSNGFLTNVGIKIGF